MATYQIHNRKMTPCSEHADAPPNTPPPTHTHFPNPQHPPPYPNTWPPLVKVRKALIQQNRPASAEQVCPDQYRGSMLSTISPLFWQTNPCSKSFRPSASLVQTHLIVRSAFRGWINAINTVSLILLEAFNMFWETCSSLHHPNQSRFFSLHQCISWSFIYITIIWGLACITYFFFFFFSPAVLLHHCINKSYII